MTWGVPQTAMYQPSGKQDVSYWGGNRTCGGGLPAFLKVVSRVVAAERDRMKAKKPVKSAAHLRRQSVTALRPPGQVAEFPQKRPSKAAREIVGGGLPAGLQVNV